MKKFVKLDLVALIIVTFALSVSCGHGGKTNGVEQSDQLSVKDTAKIIFDEYEHNFGRITAGEKVAYVFSFENIGTGPLVISSATTSCGCTVSKYDTKPLLPGKKGIIEVVFNSSGYNGKQTKTVTVKSNASVPVVLLKITGEVISSTNN